MRERYYKFSTYFKNKSITGRVQKITVDAGFSCPNRDGKISEDGCVYCNNEGFSPNARQNVKSVTDQIKQGISALERRYNASKFIVYFQAYTNTYAPVEKLKSVYDSVKEFKNVTGIAVGTRPDCINEEILELIDSYTKDYEVWIEYGLQSIHNKTLDKINRGHNYDDFLQAVALTRKKKSIKACAHVIIGLPCETDAMIIETAQAMGAIKLDGIKIHPMHVIRNTGLEVMYSKGEYKPLEMNEYIDLLIKFLEYLWPKTVIQRLTADCPKDLLVAPLWLSDKSMLLKSIDEALEQKGTFQGKLFKA